MNELISNSALFGLIVSIAAYEIGLFIKKKFRLAVFNPLLIAIFIIILFLLGFNIQYDEYNRGAKYLSYLLTPATICLAIPLYEQLEFLKKNVKAILAGIISGVITSMTTILILSILFNFNHREYVTLLPKSITTAIGIDVSTELGGIVTITVAVIIITGVLGNIMAEKVCKLFKINEPVARGVAIGSSAHAIGTAKAMEMGAIEAAISSLSIVVAGIITVFGVSVYANFM
ncbi:LrgB family protein [Pectinatus haikarae]|uniref:Murein hydrolase (TIGR00659 family) n=1 Tax=Pectinatus haikarae TaxID=349096 RepID=A0ABT9Y8Q5_9FIRM|nr:LrgB family protein [Pectinatus haikarae]MDQ0203547.1 putative murein hydrolase (TIGR00659 family) [Pectinatus haikarae]